MIPSKSHRGANPKVRWSRFAYLPILLVFAIVLSSCWALPTSGLRQLREQQAAATETPAVVRERVEVVVTATPAAPSTEADSAAAISQPVSATAAEANGATKSMVVSTTMDQLLEGLYERANPSVVNISTAVLMSQSANPFFAQPEGMPEDQLVPEGEGSGFVYDKEGHIITNNHVVESADEVWVTFADDVSVLATVVGRDPESDLAVLKVDVPESSLQPLPIGDSDNLKVGRTVVAIGNPFGLSGSMTVGIISALGRTLAAEGSRNYSIPDIIQTDAAINPGNSGGPLLNLEGEVVGVTSAIDSPVRAFTGVGLAVPASMLKKVVPELISQGYYEHPRIGISATTMNSIFAEAMDLPEDQRGVLVMTVSPDGPAEKAGLRPSQNSAEFSGQEISVGGDIIIAIDGQEIRKFDDLITYLYRYTEVGQTVKLQVLRDGSQIEIPLTLEATPRTDQ